MVNIMVTSEKQYHLVREKSLTTFEREMQDPEFKKEFEIEYQQFVCSEIMLKTYGRKENIRK